DTISSMRMFLALALIACSSPPQVAPSSPAAPPRSVASTPVHAPDRGLAPPAPTLRLPRNFVPTGYAVTLAIDPAQSGFDGKIAITGNVAQRSSVIWLHGRHLKISRAVAQRAGSEVALTATPSGDELL